MMRKAQASVCVWDVRVWAFAYWIDWLPFSQAYFS